MRINLLPIEERPLDSFTIRWEFVVILLGIVLLLVINGYGFIQSTQVKSLQNQLDGIVDENLLLKIQRNQVTDMQQQNRNLETKLSSYKEITSSNSDLLSLDSLAAIMESIPANIWVENLEIQAETILVYGYTFDTAMVSQFLRNLTGEGFRTTVRELNQQTVGNLTSFVVEVQRG